MRFLKGSLRKEPSLNCGNIVGKDTVRTCLSTGLTFGLSEDREARVTMFSRRGSGMAITTTEPSGQPSFPRIRTCCFFSSLKTLLMAARLARHLLNRVFSTFFTPHGRILPPGRLNFLFRGVE